MDSITLRRSLDAANAAGDVQRLVFLDSVWTQYLADASTVPPSDVDTLSGIVAEMDRLLSGVLHSLPPLLDLIAEGSAIDLRTSIRESAARFHIDAADLQRFLKISDELGSDFQQAAHKLRTRLEENIPAARQELNQKMDRIRAGRFTPGDLPRVVSCALGIYVWALGRVLGIPEMERVGLNLINEFC